MNPIGLFIQPRHINRNNLFGHMDRAKYVTCSVLDDLGMTVAIKPKVKYPVYREWPFEPKPNQFAAKDIMDWADAKNVDDIYYMINCEQDVTADRFDMYADLAIQLNREAYGAGVTVPYGFVVGNFASGAIKCGQPGDPNDWILKAENMLKTFNDLKYLKLHDGRPALILGLHEYTSQFAWKVSNGGEFYDQPNAWPTRLDWTKPQWHLGRNIQGLEAAYKHFKIDYRIPLIMTEGILDDMQDVPGHYRHYKSLAPLWSGWYPNRSPHRVLAEQAKWVWETVYAPWNYVLGMHIYCYGDNSPPDWEGFRVDT